MSENEQSADSDQLSVKEELEKVTVTFEGPDGKKAIVRHKFTDDTVETNVTCEPEVPGNTNEKYVGLAIFYAKSFQNIGR